MSAEFAVVLPAVVLVLVLGVSALGAGARLIRLQDAAADAARLIARGEDEARASAVVASAGGSMSAASRDDLVCVTASAAAPPPLALAVSELTATACALAGGL